ncbi:MAG: hypothetical protein O3A82_17115 [Verrucomicrobia bacterium]|nr:hypothetical protein [Verrucomicrobiota bacterium]MDA0724838.1 hypothetical protein [Verrucomicrobiota bacterium]MDA1048634.1 hypothetical protein [Verrucomicrobiota bacterium]
MTLPLVLSLLFLAPTLCLSESSVSSTGSKSPNAFDWSNVDTQRGQSEHILEAIKSWQSQDGKDGGKKLRVVYFHPKDRQPLKDHAKRWDGIMSDIQDFYRTEMKHLGYGEVTLGLERKNGKLKLHEVCGAKDDDGSYSYNSGSKIRGEVFDALQAKGINPQEETILIVCGLSRTEEKKVTIYSPYYGMGANHNCGICFTADMDWLSIDGLKPDPSKTTLQVKEHRGYEPFTLARFNTTYIGGTIHELGHGLSLPHNLSTKKEAIRGTALMGAGNYTYRKEWRDEGKGSFLTHAHALRLLVHPLFSQTTKHSKESPNLKYKKLTISHSDEKMHIRGTVQSDIPAIAMIAYNDGENKGQRGYMVNNDYDATTWTSVINPNNEFRIRVGDLRDGNHQIRLISVHANGTTVTKRLHYSMKEGMPDFKRANQEIENILSP